MIPLNGVAAGTVHTVSPLPLDATNDNVTSTSFFAGFTQNFDNINSTAKATISSFVTGTVADRNMKATDLIHFVNDSALAQSHPVPGSFSRAQNVSP